MCNNNKYGIILAQVMLFLCPYALFSYNFIWDKCSVKKGKRMQ